MKARTFSTVVLVGGVALLVAFDGVLPLYVIGAGLCLAALWEFYRMAERKGVAPFKKTALGFAALMMAANYPFDKADLAGSFTVNGILLALFTIGVLGVIALKPTKNNSLARAAVSVFGLLYVPFLFGFLLSLLNCNNGMLLAIYVIAVTKCTDIGAYLVGSWLGQHQMSPRSSPKKTWEGFAGGVAVSLMVSLGFACFWLPELWWEHALFLGLVLPPLSVVGDLIESVIKRDTDTKDSGAFIPGIGGALDLIDSVLFTAPVFFFYLLLVALY
jgi:phosphatidate cytidylyltransferase